MPKVKEEKSDDKRQDKPKAFTIKYKRPRGLRACVVCRSRKVRCDAEIHIPCTNCITFGCECTLPEAKKRGNSTGESKPKKRQLGPADEGDLPKNDDYNDVDRPTDSLPTNTAEPVLNISQVSVPPSLTSNYRTRPLLHNRDIVKSSSNGLVPRASLTFLGSSSISLVTQKVGENHVQLTDDIFDVSENSLDSVELEILKLRGAFLLPSDDLALDLINSYFEYVHSLMPVINRTEFMRKFNDPNDSPSLMLLQAVFLCGCRVSKNPLLLDSRGSNNLACMTFFRRAKALYETNYESDPISIIQTVILIGSFWEGPEDVTRNSFYWTRVAVGLAQGFGLQRDISNSPSLSSTEKKIWRRIWWCLFEKDRNVAIAFGRPLVIDLNDCDVPMLTLDDFNEDEEDEKSPYPVNETHALYFIHLVKLAEITGIIIKHQYTVKAELMKRKNKFSVIQHCDMLMGIWFTNLPPQLTYSLTDSSTQNFYSCLLNAQYYNRLYLIHRANLLRMAKSSSTNPNNYKYPSWGISFQAARMISIVSKIVMDKGQLKYCPAMFVYILFSALMMLIYHVDSPNTVIASTASDSLFISRAVLKELTLYWPIASVLMKIFDKYANDKIKRAKVIENGTRIAELEEFNATKNAMKTQSSVTEYYNQKPTNSQQNASPEDKSDYSISPTAIPHKKETTSKKSDDTSPSSAHSFPDISLVTEDLPTNQTFYDNFEPTQLFPNVNLSFPPTRAQSPSLQQFHNGQSDTPLNADATPVATADQEHKTLNPLSFGSNVYGVTANVPTTPGEAFNANFIDNSFLNMNFQPGSEGNPHEDLGSLFNFQI